MLVFSIVLINIALIAYTIPIWNEMKRKRLLPWHSVMFCIGFICDFSGTYMMYKLGGSTIKFGVHDILGYIALLLMLMNTLGSLFILHNRNELSLKRFYKFGILSWIVWLISYMAGIVANI